MIRKLQTKFIIINMAIVTVMLCIIFGLVYSSTKHNLETESISMMRRIADVPFRPGRPNEPSPELKLPYFTLQLGKKGELLSAVGGYYDLSDRAFLDELIAQSTASKQETGVIKEHNLRFCRMMTPMGITLVFADMSSETNTLHNLVKTSLLIGFFSFLLFLFISFFLSRWAVRPVAAAWQQQKQFVADASHELKTPLTVILTNAELLQDHGYSQEDQLRFSRGIHTMAQQMKSLLGNMLELAKADAEQTEKHKDTIDLSKLILDCAISFEGVFVEKGLILESSAEPGITVEGHSPSLQQMVDILLDNAQKYSAPGGTTTICLFGSGHGKCRLRVSNPGPEISPENLEKIFQRFYRMDEARTRDGSFGLGLPIAESIVSQHKGRIWAESKDGSNTFYVELHRAK